MCVCVRDRESNKEYVPEYPIANYISFSCKWLLIISTIISSDGDINMSASYHLLIATYTVWLSPPPSLLHPTLSFLFNLRRILVIWTCWNNTKLLCMGVHPSSAQYPNDKKQNLTKSSFAKIQTIVVVSLQLSNVRGKVVRSFFLSVTALITVCIGLAIAMSYASFRGFLVNGGTVLLFFVGLSLIYFFYNVGQSCNDQVSRALVLWFPDVDHLFWCDLWDAVSGRLFSGNNCL